MMDEDFIERMERLLGRPLYRPQIEWLKNGCPPLAPRAFNRQMTFEGSLPSVGFDVVILEEFQ